MLRLNFKRYGSGAPLIILHGFLGSLDNWHTLSSEWGNKGYEVYSLDMRNHGRSPHTLDHSIQLMAEDIQDFIIQNDLKLFNLLGHSMGGKVAMQYALYHPEMINHLIIADIAPVAYPRGHDQVFRAILNVDFTNIKSRKDVEEGMRTFLNDEATIQFIIKSLERNEDGTFKWKFNIKTLYNTYEDMIREIESIRVFTGKTLFIRGEKSDYIRKDDLKIILALFPHATLQTIENAGHWIHAEKPREFSDAVLHFLNN